MNEPELGQRVLAASPGGDHIASHKIQESMPGQYYHLDLWERFNKGEGRAMVFLQWDWTDNTMHIYTAKHHPRVAAQGPGL